MKETGFIRRNAEKWRKFESKLRLKDASPSELANIYIELSDDLAYANTHFPRSRSTYYLNQLTVQAHHLIYRNKKEPKNRFINFWREELPLLCGEVQKEFAYSSVFFFLAVFIGVISTAYDETFVRLILGDAYVNMTLENIRQGDAMGVYKSQGSAPMFFGITLNNVLVSFRVFAFGIFFSLGTIFTLVSNGIMLGAFQYFFYEHGLLLESMLVIWIHGTLEISAIVLAGGAGLVMGNSLLFPGTYTRLQSFKVGARKGMKIIIGLVPIFIVAGFLEGFVTRLTGMPSFLKLFIILSSASFIVYYFVIYPRKLLKNAPSFQNK